MKTKTNVRVLLNSLRKLIMVTVMLALTFLAAKQASSQVTVTESFETTVPPTGWVTAMSSGGTKNWIKDYYASYSVSGVPNGSYCAVFDSYYATAGSYASLTSKPFDLAGRGSNTPTVSLYMYRGNTFITDLDYLEVYINTTNSLTGATLLSSDGNTRINRPYNKPPETTIGWNNYIFTIPAGFSGMTNYIIFKAVSAYGDYISIDQVQITSYPCIPPTIATTTPASGVGANAYTLGATASQGTVSWYAAATGGSAIATGTSYTTPNISATTTYYVGASYNGCVNTTRTPVVATIASHYDAGTGIAINGTTITNTAPDQTVTIAGTGATTVTGAYPNFTINSTDVNTNYIAGTGLSLSGTTLNSVWTLNSTTGHINNNNSGNLGIGTNDPQASLHIKSTDITKPAITVEGSGTAFMLFYKNSLSQLPIGLLGFGDPATNDFSFDNLPGNILLNNWGFVGIHTTNPTRALDVVGVIRASQSFEFPDGSSQYSAAKTYTAGTGIDLTDNIITNTTPNQPITLTGSGGTTVSGTYPTFNIASSNAWTLNSESDLSYTATDVSIHNKDLKLRNSHHGIGWYGLGKTFNNEVIDGPVVYGYSGGALGATGSGNNVALRWTIDGKVGIGTTTPASLLTVTGNNGLSIIPEIQINDVQNSAYVKLRSAGGDARLISNESILMFLNGDKTPNALNSFAIYTDDEGASNLSRLLFQVDKTGGKLDGEFHCKKVIIESTIWPDYVFSDSYKLSSLKSIEKYIKENKHLPDVPSASEIKEKGIDVGEINTTLMKKVEELTLHLIEQSKKIEGLEIEVNSLKGKQ